MKLKLTIGILGVFILLLIWQYSLKDYSEINILATSDLNGFMPYQLTSHIKDEKSKNKNTILVDAGDFLDFGRPGSDMSRYCFDKFSINKSNRNYIELPIAKEMKETGYDTVVLGNQEFLYSTKDQVDNIVSDLNKQGIDVLSANTHKKNGDNYVKPYIMKTVPASKGTVKVGILGLTIKEIDQRYETLSNGEEKIVTDELKDLKGINGSLYMNDLVEEAKYWVPVMKKDTPDIIIAVVHSGEKEKNEKETGNKIQDLAQEVNGIDAIVAGHTHKHFDQHDYTNKAGENVIVTQPGQNGEAISKINFKLEQKDNKWVIADKSSKVTKFEKDDEDINFDILNKKVTDTSLELSEKYNGRECKNFSLKDLTPFEWDKLYAFDINTSPEKIYETIGYKHRDIKKAKNGDAVQMIFMNDGKVVCHLYGYEKTLFTDFIFDKSEFKDGVLTIYPDNNDKFNVTSNQSTFTLKLNHVK